MHPLINSIKQRVQPMGGVKDRIHCVDRRLQARNDPEFRAAIKNFNDGKRSSANRPKTYKKGGKTTKLNDNSNIKENEWKEGPPGYYKVSDYGQNALIKKEWLPAFKLCVLRIVPEEIYQHIVALNMGNVMTAKCRNTDLI